MYIENFLYPYLCGYRKIFKMLALIENWKKVPDNKDVEGAVLMDLSKPFDMINHDLFQQWQPYVLYSYLNKTWHKTKINQKFSSWKELSQGVPQGSVFGSLLSNIYLNNFFFLFEFTDLWNFVDNTTFYACDMELNALTHFRPIFHFNTP